MYVSSVCHQSEGQGRDGELGSVVQLTTCFARRMVSVSEGPRHRVGPGQPQPLSSDYAGDGDREYSANAPYRWILHRWGQDPRSRVSNRSARRPRKTQRACEACGIHYDRVMRLGDRSAAWMLAATLVSCGGGGSDPGAPGPDARGEDTSSVDASHDAFAPSDATIGSDGPWSPGAEASADGSSRGEASQTQSDATTMPAGTVVQCGSALCAFDDAGVPVFCCTTDLGVTGSCVHFGDQCGNSHYYYCEGPHNCVSTASCCFFQGGTTCLPNGSCAGANGETVCQDARDCGDAGESCCPLADGSTIRACSLGACP
jgi:hypothetical protein